VEEGHLDSFSIPSDFPIASAQASPSTQNRKKKNKDERPKRAHVAGSAQSGFPHPLLFLTQHAQFVILTASIIPSANNTICITFSYISSILPITQFPVPFPNSILVVCFLLHRFLILDFCGHIFRISTETGKPHPSLETRLRGYTPFQYMSLHRYINFPTTPKPHPQMPQKYLHS